MPARKAAAKKAPAKKAPAKRSGRKGPAAEAVAVVAAQAVESPVVQDRMERLGVQALEYMEAVFDRGGENQRIALADRLFKSMMAAQAKQGGGDLDAKRAEFQRMMAEYGSVIGGG